MKDELVVTPAAPGDRSLYKCVSMTVTMFRLHNCAAGCSWLGYCQLRSQEYLPSRSPVSQKMCPENINIWLTASF